MIDEAGAPPPLCRRGVDLLDRVRARFGLRDYGCDDLYLVGILR
jgi:hypothetical protein